MSTIRIKQLRLENFKSHRHFELNLNGQNASIYGDNATGKTSVYDALTWLLFGKDSLGNGEKNIEIKPLNAAGEVRDHDAMTEVEAVLLVDGTEVSLRRTYKELWVTKRGCLEPVYDGNTSEYFVDGVPCKKYAFHDKIDSIVSEDTFRMLTSVSHFANGITWQQRRDILFDISGIMTDREIMATNPQFVPLAEAMGNLTLTDLKKKLLNEKKSYTGLRDELPARISECEKTVADLSGLDFAKVKMEVDILNARKEQISGDLLVLNRNSALEDKKVELGNANLELEKLNVENRAYRAEQERKKPDMGPLLIQQARVSQQLNLAKGRHDMATKELAELDAKIASCRERWMAVNGENRTVGTICPTCGQTLPASQIKAAQDKVESEKRDTLRDIEQMASNYKSMRAAAEERQAQSLKEIDEIQQMVNQATADITAAESATVTVVDMPTYAERYEAINAVIARVNDEMYKLSQDAQAAGADLRQQLAQANMEISEKMALVGKESLLTYSRQRIDELKQEAAANATHLQNIEMYLFLMEEFTRYKTDFVEDGVNKLFRIARFRLFREQANGGIEDRCDVVFDGVPYIALNSGAKINVGIDIINTLSAAYGVSVPLFVDNAESVTRLEGSQTQIIRLVVSENDKELRINYEN